MRENGDAIALFCASLCSSMFVRYLLQHIIDLVGGGAHDCIAALLHADSRRRRARMIALKRDRRAVHDRWSQTMDTSFSFTAICVLPLSNPTSTG